MTILGFENQHASALWMALQIIFPNAGVEVFEEYETAIPLHRADLVVTDMMLPATIKARDLDYCGVAIMLQCMESGVPCICLSGSHHHDGDVSFGNHLLQAVGLEMVGEVDKTDTRGWIDGIKSAIRGDRHWAFAPGEDIAKAIKSYKQPGPTGTPYKSMEDSPSW